MTRTPNSMLYFSLVVRFYSILALQPLMDDQDSQKKPELRWLPLEGNPEVRLYLSSIYTSTELFFFSYFCLPV